MSSQINLVDPSLLPKRALINSRAVAVIVGVSLLAVAVHGGVESAQLRAALATTAVQANAAPAVDAASEPVEGMPAKMQRLQRGLALRDALAQVHSLPDDSAGLLQQVMAALPDTLWLTEIDLSGNQSIRIAGGALDASALAAFSARLARIDALKGTPIQVLQLEPQAGGELAAVDDSGESAALAPLRRARPTYAFALASRDGTATEVTP